MPAQKYLIHYQWIGRNGQRLGYLDHGRPVTGHDGPPVWPTWRPPAA